MNKSKLITMLIGLILDMITPDRLKDFADMVLDFAEDSAKNSKNKFDDATILQMCKLIRVAFDIPDNDND